MPNLNTVAMSDRTATLNELLVAQNAGFTVEYSRVWKNNSELEGYILRSESSNCSPTIYYNNDWYAKSDEEVVAYLDEMYQEHARSLDVSHLTDAEYIKAHILPKVVSCDNIPNLQERRIAFIQYLDMAVLFYVPVDEFNAANELASVQVTEMLLATANISHDEALELSIRNLESEVEIKTMAEIIFGDMGLEETDFGVPEIPMYVVSNHSRINGAASMLCPSVRERLEDCIGGNVAILPSSIHECIAVPYNSDEELEMYRSMVSEVNSTTVEEIDKLTDSVYCFSGAELKQAV